LRSQAGPPRLVRRGLVRFCYPLVVAHHATWRACCFLSEASKPALTPETSSRDPQREGRYRGGRSSGAPLPPTDLATAGVLETSPHLRPGSPAGGTDSYAMSVSGVVR